MKSAFKRIMDGSPKVNPAQPWSYATAVAKGKYFASIAANPPTKAIAKAARRANDLRPYFVKDGMFFQLTLMAGFYWGPRGTKSDHFAYIAIRGVQK